MQQHIPYQEGISLMGTVCYASVNNHLSIQQTRRDDLESLGYVLIYLLRGSLPWQSSEQSRRLNYKAVLKKKRDLINLCKSLPSEFAVYLRYTRSLEFNEKPDYAYLRSLFHSKSQSE